MCGDSVHLKCAKCFREHPAHLSTPHFFNIEQITQSEDSSVLQSEENRSLSNWGQHLTGSAVQCLISR